MREFYKVGNKVLCERCIDKNTRISYRIRHGIQVCDNCGFKWSFEKCDFCGKRAIKYGKSRFGFFLYVCGDHVQELQKGGIEEVPKWW